MSNTWILKGLIWFSIGAVISNVITRYICEKRFEENLHEMDAELLKKEHEETANKLSKDLVEAEKELEKEQPKQNDIPESAVQYTSYYKKENKGETMNTDKFDDFPRDNDADNPFDGGGELGPLDDEPYVINETEYITNDDYEKVYIKWFAGDNVFVGEDENVMEDEDVYGMIGTTATEKFGEESNDEDVVYIRNEGVMADFEVERVKGRYSG